MNMTKIHKAGVLLSVVVLASGVCHGADTVAAKATLARISDPVFGEGQAVKLAGAQTPPGCDTATAMG